MDFQSLSHELIRLSTILFAFAVLHTFMTPVFLKLSARSSKKSFSKALFYFLGEVELVFGFWAFIWLVCIALKSGTAVAADHLSSVNYSEAVFVFVIMCVASSKPVLQFAEQLISNFARRLPIASELRFFCALFILGPLLGSLITEPAAMTVCAMLALRYFQKGSSLTFRYVSLALLFVNVSIGGTLTHFAAPPVLMVVKPWGLTASHLFFNYGLKAALAIIINTSLTVYFFRSELKKINQQPVSETKVNAPAWMTVSHLVFMACAVMYHSSITICVGLFLLFAGWTRATEKYQSRLKIKESLMVGFFLAGLVTLGKTQDWWLAPLLSSLNNPQLFIGATVLTGITDNAALTYLGSLAPDLSERARYLLLAGAVTGGGLTVIANAPNPAGMGILGPQFGESGVSPVLLVKFAIPFTVVAALSFYFL